MGRFRKNPTPAAPAATPAPAKPKPHYDGPAPTADELFDFLAEARSVEHPSLAAEVAKAGRGGLPLTSKNAMMASMVKMVANAQIGQIVDDARQYSRARFAQ